MVKVCLKIHIFPIIRYGWSTIVSELIDEESSYWDDEMLNDILWPIDV
jgi:hypothetical protein